MYINKAYSFLIMLCFVELCFAKHSNSTILDRSRALIIPEFFNFLSCQSRSDWKIRYKHYFIKKVMISPPRKAIHKNEYIGGMHSKFELSIYEVKAASEIKSTTSNAISTSFQSEASLTSGTLVHKGVYTTSYSDRDRFSSTINKLKGKNKYIIAEFKNTLIEHLITIFSTFELLLYEQYYESDALLERENDLFDISATMFLLSSIYSSEFLKNMAHTNAFSYYISATYRLARPTIELYLPESKDFWSFTLIYLLFFTAKYTLNHYPYSHRNAGFQILLLLSFPYLFSRIG